MTCNLETSQFPESNIQLLLPFAHAAQGVRVVIKFLKQKWNLYRQGIFLWYADNTLIIFWAVDILLKFLSIRILMILFFSRLSSKIFLDMQFRNWWYFGQGMILPFAGIGVERNGMGRLLHSGAACFTQNPSFLNLIWNFDPKFNTFLTLLHYIWFTKILEEKRNFHRRAW